MARSFSGFLKSSPLRNEFNVIESMPAPSGDRLTSIAYLGSSTVPEPNCCESAVPSGAGRAATGATGAAGAGIVAATFVLGEPIVGLVAGSVDGVVDGIVAGGG